MRRNQLESVKIRLRLTLRHKETTGWVSGFVSDTNPTYLQPDGEDLSSHGYPNVTIDMVKGGRDWCIDIFSSLWVLDRTGICAEYSFSSSSDLVRKLLVSLTAKN